MSTDTEEKHPLPTIKYFHHQNPEHGSDHVSIFDCQFVRNAGDRENTTVICNQPN